MIIKLTGFAKRQFDSKFGATNILDYTPEEFEAKICDLQITYARNSKKILYFFDGGLSVFAIDGYAPFCKLLPIKNFTDARVGSMPITLENYQYIRSGYSARKESELPIFSRWLELPISKPRAEYLMLVLYSKEQIDKESDTQDGGLDVDWGVDVDWGIVAILGQSHNHEEPMKPETMIRNALGISEGGSGVPLDRDAYLKSVDFWSKNITVK